MMSANRCSLYPGMAPRPSEDVDNKPSDNRLLIQQWYYLSVYYSKLGQ